MRNFRNLIWFCVGIAISAVLMIPSAYAQTAHIDPAFNRIMNAMVSNTAGVTTQSIPSGVTTTGTGTSTVTTASGLRIPVPQSATATVSKSAIAKAATKIAGKGINLAGAAFLGYELYKEMLGDDTFVACPAPKFVCKISPAQPDTSTEPYSGYCYGTSGGCYPTMPQYCAAAAPNYTHIAPDTFVSGRMTCYKDQTRINVISLPTGTCAAPKMVAANGGCYAPTTSEASPVTDAQIEQTLLDKMNADPSKSKAYYDALREDYKKTRVLDGNYPVSPDTPLNFPPDTPIVLPPDSPLSIYSPNVVTPEKVVKTETKPMSDGSQVLEITKQTTTVSTELTGTTVGDTKISHPTTTTETKTSTNTSTGNSTTSTTVINESPQESKPAEEPKDPCLTNPNRAGCALLGEPPAAEAIPSQDIPITVTPVPFASVAGCPSSLAFEAYGAKSISYQPMCDTMTTVRPLFLALASLTAAIVFMGALKL